MSTFFLDTSSLVKLYHQEPDSAQLRQQIDLAKDQLVVAELTLVEFPAAFGRKVRRGELTTALADVSLVRFSQDWPAFRHVPLDSALLAQAAALVKRHHALALRSLDALQLAAALAAGPLDAFFTHDGRLRDAATAEGLPVR